MRLTAGLEPGGAVRCALPGYTIMYMIGMVGIMLYAACANKVTVILILHKLVRAIRHTYSSVIYASPKNVRACHVIFVKFKPLTPLNLKFPQIDSAQAAPQLSLHFSKKTWNHREGVRFPL